MGTARSTRLRDISAVGAELDESQLNGISGGTLTIQSITYCGDARGRGDDYVC
ncbi:hypothetical protein GCM10010517_79880 [Streptosporangium fragile]|uniref:SapB/AmfS family lantipeptide n=1 Tax=Streptosporangium fragile TaxID=46186 RepID=A0ABN3WH26_9ACTN